MGKIVTYLGEITLILFLIGNFLTLFFLLLDVVLGKNIAYILRLVPFLIIFAVDGLYLISYRKSQLAGEDLFLKTVMLYLLILIFPVIYFLADFVAIFLPCSFVGGCGGI